MNSDLLRQWLPIGVSALSLIVASLALGWNIYRDVILRARVHVSFAVVTIVTPGVGVHGKHLRLTAVNHGPGNVRVEMIVGRSGSKWAALVGRARHFFILNDQSNPLNPRLPAQLAVGDSLTLLLPHDEKSLLGSDALRIGVSDSFGRQHFAPRGDLTRARRTFVKDFPENQQREI